MPLEKRNGDFHCFCDNKLANEGISETWGHTFETKLDNTKTNNTEGDYCKDWLMDVATMYAAEGLVPFFIVLFNVVVELIIFGLSFTRRPSNDTLAITQTASSIFVFQFMNMGLSLIFTVINLKIKNADAFIRLLDGEYDDFNVAFYTKVGPQYIALMFFQLLSPHILPFIYVCCKRS